MSAIAATDCSIHSRRWAVDRFREAYPHLRMPIVTECPMIGKTLTGCIQTILTIEMQIVTLTATPTSKNISTAFAFTDAPNAILP